MKIYFSEHSDNSQHQKWQDEISTGFDRLVAYATEVDKRRRSTDDSNSPQQSSFPSANDVKLEPFVDNRMSTLSMKFKGASASSANAAYLRQSNVAGASTYGSSNRAVSSIPSPVDFDNSSNSDPFLRQTGSRSPLPGENLPEHHFKKRYFAETRDFVGKTETSSSYSISPVHKKRPEDLSFRGSASQSGPSPPRNSSQSSASSQLRDLDDMRKTNSPASSSSLLDSTTGMQ